MPIILKAVIGNNLFSFFYAEKAHLLSWKSYSSLKNQVHKLQTLSWNPNRLLPVDSARFNRKKQKEGMYYVIFFFFPTCLGHRVLKIQLCENIPQDSSAIVTRISKVKMKLQWFSISWSDNVRIQTFPFCITHIDHLEPYPVPDYDPGSRCWRYENPVQS